MRRSRGEMHSGHGRLRVCLCVCLSVCPSIAAFAHDSTDPDATFRNSRRCPLVVHCWAVLQSVHGFRCCDNIATYAKFQPVLVLAKCLLRWSRWSTIQSLKKKVLAVFLRGGRYYKNRAYLSPACLQFRSFYQTRVCKPIQCLWVLETQQALGTIWTSLRNCVVVQWIQGTDPQLTSRVTC